MLEFLFYRHLEEDEPLYIVFHKHWMHAALRLAAPVMTFSASWLAFYLAPIRLVGIAVILADIACSIWFLRRFLDYYLDAWIITDRAVIDVEWRGWFHRQSTRIDYTSIEGVSYEIKGMLNTIFGFGKVSVERMGAGTAVSMENMPKPRDIESTILACQSAFLHKKNMKDTETVKDIIADIVAERLLLKEHSSSDVGISTVRK